MSADWHPICPNCGAEARQDVAEELHIFYKGDALHIHGFPSDVTCLKCRWEYTYDYSCAECVAEAVDGGSDAKAPKKGAKKSRKSD